MKKVIIGLVIVVALGGAAWALTSSSDDKSNNQTSTSSQPAQSSASNSSSSASSDQTVAATITYSDNGFSPSTVTIKAGDKVTLKNTSSSREVDFDSDPHPTHTDDPELNLGPVASGESKTFVVAKTGSHGYHNHLNPSETGTIVAN